LEFVRKGHNRSRGQCQHDESPNRDREGRIMTAESDDSESLPERLNISAVNHYQTLSDRCRDELKLTNTRTGGYLLSR
jgi:hypothetical protein